MLRRRGPRRRRRLRRLIVLAGTVSGITAVRNLMMARNEKRFSALIADPSVDRPR